MWWTWIWRFNNSDSDFQQTLFGEYQNYVIDVTCRKTDNPRYKVYGTKDELENWKYFVFNNKLPLFINIVMTIDQHNNSKNYVPWLTDKHYTDSEIYSIFKFTED